MRRLALIVTCCLCCQVLAPARADAWWGWLDQLSGPGSFIGPQFEFRLVCFGDESAAKGLVARFANANMLTREAYTDETMRAAKAEWARLIAELGRTNTTLTVWSFEEWTATETRLRQSVEALTLADFTQFNTTLNATAGNQKNAAAASRAARSASRVGKFIDDQRNVVLAFVRTQVAIDSFGVSWSACSYEKARRTSIDLGVSSWTASESSNYAGGHSIKLTTLMPSFSWRIFSDPRWDVVDAGVGAGVYWFSSAGFASSTGVILQPVRFDFHVPSSWSGKTVGQRVAALLVFRFAVDSFPGGFEPQVFAATGSKAVRIPAELNKTWTVFLTLEPLLQQLRH